jgi:two-component system, NtrC family, sensor kinase
MIAANKTVPNSLGFSPVKSLNLESTLQDLSLYEFQLEAESSGISVAKAFDSNPMLPGVILTERGELLGMISRRRFLEYMGRPYGLELFLKRPIKSLYLLARADTLILPCETLIVDAAKRSLQRPTKLLYEPIVVEVAPEIYKLLDVHELMVAQSQIHELAMQLLNDQTQAHMIQTEKMASLGQMMAGIAHEILNPVNFISGNIDYLSRYSEDLIRLVATYDAEISNQPQKVTELKEDIEFDYLQEDLVQILSSIQQGTDRLVKIIHSMRSFTHMGEGTQRPSDLHECIDSTLLILHNRIKYSVELVKNYGELPLVPCYSGQLSQVFMNIISNALDALLERAAEEKEHGNSEKNWRAKITITTELVEIQQKTWVAIRIADNGPGIPMEIQERIFETFFTTKPVGKGTGLGLAISHQIVVEKHAGKLNLRSQPGKGTQFEILLPLE